jgi:hypothetical protein
MGADATKIGPGSRNENFTSRCCHVLGGLLVSFLEALRKRPPEKEKRNETAIFSSNVEAEEAVAASRQATLPSGAAVSHSIWTHFTGQKRLQAGRCWTMLTKGLMLFSVHVLAISHKSACTNCKVECEMGGLYKMMTRKRAGKTSKAHRMLATSPCFWAIEQFVRFTAHCVVTMSAHRIPKWTMTGPEGPR